MVDHLMSDAAEQQRQPTQRIHAFVFPGQGSQYVGMGGAVLERSPAAAAVMERADAALCVPLSRLIAEGPGWPAGR